MYVPGYDPRKSWQKGKIFRSPWRLDSYYLHTYRSKSNRYVSSAHDRLVNSDTYFATSNMTHKIQADTYVVGAYVLQIHMMPIKAACIYTTKSRSLNFIKLSKSPPTYLLTFITLETRVDSSCEFRVLLF